MIDTTLHLIYKSKCRKSNFKTLKSLLNKGFKIKESYRGPDWSPAIYLYIDKE